MNTENVYVIFLVNHTISQITSFIKRKYLQIYKLIITSQTVVGQKISQTFGKGV